MRLEMDAAYVAIIISSLLLAILFALLVLWERHATARHLLARLDSRSMRLALAASHALLIFINHWQPILRAFLVRLVPHAISRHSPAKRVLD